LREDRRSCVGGIESSSRQVEFGPTVPYSYRIEKENTLVKTVMEVEDAADRSEGPEQIPSDCAEVRRRDLGIWGMGFRDA
jgi:hypothetical protein